MRRPVLLLAVVVALAAAAAIGWLLLRPAPESPVVAEAARTVTEEVAQTIEERRDFMKGLGEQLAVARAYVQEGVGNSGDVAEAARAIAERAERITGLFPEGTGMHEVEVETGARPAIWEDPDDFAAKAEALQEAALAFAGLADGDPGREAVGGGMATFGQEGCGACHRVYREDIN